MLFIKNLIYKFLNNQISNIYAKRFNKYQNTPKGVFWNNKLSQDLRLNIILDKIIALNPGLTSIADIGCGYGRFFEIIKERKFNNKIEYFGFDINQELINFCKSNKNFINGKFFVRAHPLQNIDFVIMSGTYNLSPINNVKLWENYIIENLKSNWRFTNKALIFNCLINKERQIKNNLYYTELSWIKKICENNFGKTSISQNNLLPNDATLILKKN